MVFMPMLSAHPSSRSIVVGSNVSACHISSSLIAVDGRKFAPTGHGWLGIPFVGLRFGPALLGMERRNDPSANSKTQNRVNAMEFAHRLHAGNDEALRIVSTLTRKIAKEYSTAPC